MGRKAKIKAIRNRLLSSTKQSYEKDVDAMEKISQLHKDPDYEMVFMDPHVPIFVFVKHKDGELAIVGKPEAIPEMRKCFSQAIAETLLEKSERASEN